MTHLREPAVTLENSFATEYRVHRDRVFRLALRYGGGRTPWAEDLLHDVFLRLFAQLRDGDPPANTQAWLYRVTANLAISRIRSESSMLTRIKRWAGAGRVQESAEAPVLRRETAALALAALQSLPAQQRVVMCMRLLDDKSQREIAQVLALSEGYVSKLYARARQTLTEAGWEDEHA